MGAVEPSATDVAALRSDGRPRRRGPYGKSAITRNAILDAAGRALQLHGYRGASLRMIGELAGIDQSGIMHYFPSKEALMLAVLEQADPESAGFFAAHPIQSLADVPNAMLDLARANMRDPAAMGTFAVLEAEATAVEHPLNSYFRERGERRRGSLATWFRLVSEAGLMRPGVDPDVAASSLLALWQGIEIQWLNAPAGLDVARHLEVFLSLVLADEWEARLRQLDAR